MKLFYGLNFQVLTFGTQLLDSDDLVLSSLPNCATVDVTSRLLGGRYNVFVCTVFFCTSENNGRARIHALHKNLKLSAVSLPCMYVAMYKKKLVNTEQTVNRKFKI